MEVEQISLFPDALDASTREEEVYGTPYEDDEDVSVVKYARLHGISKDYLSENPINHQSLPYPISAIQKDSADGLGIAGLDLATASALKERLVVDKAAASLIRAVFALQHPETEEETTPSRRKIADLKQELPILKTDDELDLRRFGVKAVPDFGTIKFPLEIVNNEKDEGLGWSTAHCNLPAQYGSQANAEKLEVHRDALLYLQETLRERFTAMSVDEIALAELHHRRNKSLDPVTPPLLPMSPPLTPFVPSSPAGQLELLSDHTDPAIAEAKALEDNLSKQDAILPLGHHDEPDDESMLLDHSDIGQIYSPLRSLGRTPSSPVKRKHTELKVEVPLTPPTTLHSSDQHVKSVSFAGKLHEYIPELPPTVDCGDDTVNSQNSFDTFFAEQVTPFANKANRELEQEQLQEADSTKRVRVPVMDFSLLKAPWTIHIQGIHDDRGEYKTGLDWHRRLMASVEREKLELAPQWPGLAKIERELPWSPFPMQLGKVAMNDSIEDDGSLSELLTSMNIEGLVDSASLIWKPEGLRILDDLDESEGELELASVEEESDMKTRLKKRKLQMENAQKHRLKAETGRPGAAKLVQGIHVSRREEHTTETVSPSRTNLNTGSSVAPRRDSDLMFGGLFSASAALSKFMETQGMSVKKPKLEAPPEAIPSIKAPPATTNHSKQADTSTGTQTPPSRMHQPTSQPTSARPLPGPEIPSYLPARAMIISSILLRQRRLTQHIQALYPSLELIERDFTAHQRQPSPLAEEADIILSPATGIICTTLQKIKQRALPGQIGHAGVRERIQTVAARYERLIVYVSEGKASNTGLTSDPYALDDRDCEALASLIGFAASLGADVQIIYVAGGEEELARWIVGATVKFGANAADADGDPTGVKLLQDETLWELFLRRAGLNAFAAQVILAALKAPAPTLNEQTSSSPLAGFASAERKGTYGLTAFVVMAPDERIRRFQGVMGGTKVLEQVNPLLEQKWVSAANDIAG